MICFRRALIIWNQSAQLEIFSRTRQTHSRDYKVPEHSFQVPMPNTPLL